MTNKTSSLIRAAALAATLTCTGLAQAQIANGGFELDLTGWNTLGNASIVGGAPQGAGQLWLDTADGAVDAGTLAQGLGLANVTQLDRNDSFAYEGSMASQSFTATAGQQLSFVWQFGSAETSGDPAYQDYAFVLIDGQLIRLGGAGDAGSGNQSFSLVLSGSGQHSVAFGVVDLGDTTVDSNLRIDGVAVSAIPEPGSMSLTLAGLAMLGLRARRRRNAD